jgi:hypothetical protein
MSEVTPKLIRRARLTDNHWPLRNLLYWSCLFLIFALAGASSARGSDFQRAPASSVGPGLPFAIADFDGDLRPDLARVQAGPSDSFRVDYWIQLQLTASGTQSINVFGPLGGLQIAARDVNGDHAIDLVLTTAWLGQPVAILLNDGHGRFTRADLAAFPGAFRDSKTTWTSGGQQLADSIGVPPQSLAGAYQQTQLPYPGPPARLGSLSSGAFLLNPLLLSHRGRAPPART